MFLPAAARAGTARRMRDHGAVTRLIVIRHAEAAGPPGLPDRERPLTAAGESAARAAGAQIRPLKPELVLCSPAVRARRTAELLGLDAPIEIEPVIYQGDSDDLIELLCRTETAIGTVALVGHNPAVSRLVWDLTGRECDAFPPGGYAVVDLDGSWEETGPGRGTLVSFHRPHRT